MTLWGCFHRKTTLLTGVEKSGINWPGAREYGYMAGSPSYGGRCCISQCYQSYVSCSCKVCSSVTSCLPEHGGRKEVQQALRAGEPPSEHQFNLHTHFPTQKCSFAIPHHHCRCLVPLGQKGEVGFSDCVSKMCLAFVAFCLHYPLRSESCAHLRCTRTNTDRRKRLCVAGQWFFSPPHNHFKHHVICGTEVHLLRCRTAELGT